MTLEDIGTLILRSKVQGQGRWFDYWEKTYLKSTATAGGNIVEILPAPSTGYCRLWTRLSSFLADPADGDIVNLEWITPPLNQSPFPIHGYRVNTAYNLWHMVPWIGTRYNHVNSTGAAQLWFEGLAPMILTNQDSMRLNWSITTPVAQTMATWGTYFDFPM